MYVVSINNEKKLRVPDRFEDDSTVIQTRFTSDIGIGGMKAALDCPDFSYIIAPLSDHLVKSNHRSCSSSAVLFLLNLRYSEWKIEKQF